MTTSPRPLKKQHSTKRDLLSAYMHATATGEYHWLYLEHRPLHVPPKLAMNVVADCSYGVAILCAWAGLPDPTGNHFNGWGNSESIFNHLPHIPLAQADVGDILLFGPSGSVHATMILKPDRVNPLLWSHGHRGAPNLYHLADDRRTPVTVCRIQA